MEDRAGSPAGAGAALRRFAIFCSLLLAGPGIALAQGLIPQGGEFAIAGSRRGDQVHPAAALNSNGGYLVWQDNAVTPQGARIQAERLDSSFRPAGSPFTVSAAWRSRATGDQENPQVSLLQDGGAAIVWQGGRQRGKRSFEWIYARFFDATGRARRRDIVVSQSRRTPQSDPCVATLANGNVVVAWSSDGQDGNLQGIFARMFAANGRPQGREFQVNLFTAHNQRTPAVAALPNGGFVVAWISELQRSASTVNVYARRFDGSGNPNGGEFSVDENTVGACANPTVAASSQGGFAVAWSQNETPILTSANATIVISTNQAPGAYATNSWDVFGRVFDANALPVTAAFRLNAYTYGDQFGPRLAASGNSYMAVWNSLGQPDSQGHVDPWGGVFAQSISSDGSLGSTNDVHVNTGTASRQIQPTVASDGAGRFLAIWTSFVLPGNFDLFSQQFSAGQ